MRNTINVDDKVSDMLTEFVTAICKSKTFYVHDEDGFLLKIRVESI